MCVLSSDPPLPPLRVLLDRAYTDYDSVFHRLDPEILDLPLPSSPPPPPATTSSPATDKFHSASTSETNTSDRSSSSFNSSLSSPSSTDLSQILLNIKSCRWRHFRPRTLPLHELDNAHPLFRRLSRGLKCPVSASTAGGQPHGSRPGKVVPAPAPIVGKWFGDFYINVLHSKELFKPRTCQSLFNTSTFSQILTNEGLL